MKNFIRILRYAIPYKAYALLNILFNILSVVFSLFSLTMIAPFLDLLFLTNDSAYEERMLAGEPGFQLSVESAIDNFYYYLTKMIVEEDKLYALVFICIAVGIIIFFKNLFRYLAMYFLAPVRNGVVKDLRNEIFNKTLVLPLSYYSEERKGDILSRMTADVQEVEWSIMSSLEMAFRDPVNIIIFLTTMVLMSPELTLFVFILLPLTGLLIGKIAKSLKRSSARGKEKMGLLLSIMEETLTGLRIIKAFNAEKYMNNKFREENRWYTNIMVGMYRKTDLASPMSEFLGVFVLLLILYFGGRLVLGPDSSLSSAVFITYIAIFSQLIPPAKSFTTAYYNIQKGIASTERINKILDAPEIITEKENAQAIETFQKEVEYRNVSFQYGTEPVLKGISLKVPKGKTVALVGQSGAGKSTLADLLPRFYDCTDGEVLVDGISVKDLKIKDLRSLMGIVTQESLLFNDTVFNNIAFGMKDAKEEDVMAAAKIANAHEFILQMKKGYHSNIGDRGSKLSGGQRQRLSIARAVFKNPPILILDEATSALDTESERLVQDALFKLMKNRTSIVIAHRLSTIQHVDEILVMQQGQIIERGTHQELLLKGGAFKKLYDMQMFV